jgi:hypothetical protein
LGRKREYYKELIFNFISIENRYNRPYFKINGAKQMADVIWIRKGSESKRATPQQIEELYKHRFRIDENVIMQMERHILDDIENWKCHFNAHTCNIEAYYSKNPLFQIIAHKISV